MSTKQVNEIEISEILAREFGANADYVGQILERYTSNPESVDEEWRDYFAEIGIAAPPAPLAPPVATAPPPAAPVAPAVPAKSDGARTPEHVAIKGVAKKIVENMEASLEVPTATSYREIPIKLLDENRRVINKYLQSHNRKVSFTHIIAWAIVRAVEAYPSLNHGYETVDGEAYRVEREHVNLGVAVDVTKKDGSRALLVPNVKSAETLSFADFLAAYDDVVKRARDSKLQLSDFAGTTITLTNPGTIGTTASNPRLMAGQGAIIATGSIAFPPEFQAMTPQAVSRLGISKVMTITSTYDHRIIQGAESGQFLARIHELLLGADDFYEGIFADLGVPFKPLHWAEDQNPLLMEGDRREIWITRQAKVFELITMYRVRGHLIADIDPLGLSKMKHHPELDPEYHGLTVWDLDREFVTGGLGGEERATLRRILEMLQSFYCGTVGAEYRHISSPEEKDWLRTRIESDRPEIEPEVRKQIMWKLISAEAFERFLGRKYIGQKRFSVEGGETIVALLDQLIEGAAARGVEDVTIGMSHRGRLNVIANVIGKFCERIFTSFEGSSHPDFPHDVSDVKYHQGASGIRETMTGERIRLLVSPNPSHLEFVNPVIEGRVRAKQDRAEGPIDARWDRFLPVLVHGDAAFAGEGVVFETLNMSQLDGYETGGTIHIIVNNQIGFTTTPEAGRSSTYSTDVARTIQAPIFHVNGDDPDAAYHTLQIALDYRQQFNRDVVIDLIGFRRHGHNEGDEPTYTQPVMYREVERHPGPRTLYGAKLVAAGVMTAEEIDQLIDERVRRYENALAGAKEIVARTAQSPAPAGEYVEPERVDLLETGIGVDAVARIAPELTEVPKQFNLNPKVVTLLSRRAKMISGASPVDWGLAEALAFSSLVAEGTPVRLSGEDSSRGTFSHRHAVFVDTSTGEPWSPIKNLGPDQAPFEVFDSPLSEAGVLGFEYGYSVDAPETLVMWEAQFGDFANAAQVIVDQFIASGEAKWGLRSRLVLLLPHGFEGQGPEHSSARLERFLQLAAEGNLQICYPSTPAQYFHLLRRQMHQGLAKPLVVMTPKSLLRLPESSSAIAEIANGGFQPILRDAATSDGEVRRAILCTGKVYFDLASERASANHGDAAIIRVEQLYPFPAGNIADALASFPQLETIVWAQEEPANMGAWSFVAPRLSDIIGGRDLRYVGRPPRAGVATGSYTIHQMEQKELVRRAFE
jgi:2-oxoglutarate dehydrogenase E1 component